MDDMDYTVVLIILAFATILYRIGKSEYNKGFLFSAISLLLSVITFFVLAWGKLASIGVQMGLFVILTILNIYRKPWSK